MNQQTTLPPFSLYSVSNQCLKTCFQSENITILCNISGPYFEKNKITIEPIINCSIIGSTFSQQKMCYFNKLVRQVTNQVIVKEKYLRMNFDVKFHIVELRDQSQILPAVINLLCFSLIIFGVQIKSVFSCSQVWMNDEKICWKSPNQNQKNIKKMCLAIQSSQKKIIYSSFEGQFAFVHFQRLSNVLMDANQQINNYIIKKATQINEQYQN